MSHLARALATAAILATVFVAGCDAPDRAAGHQPAGTASTTGGTTGNASPFEPTSATSPAAVDFASLLLQPGDLSDDQDTFTVQSTRSDLDGHPGASTLFVNTDQTRAISITLAGFPDGAAANAARQQTLDTASTIVTGWDPVPLGVGTDGTITRGNAPDGSKAVTLVLFTQGPVLARLEFDSATGDATTDRFITDIAKMQQIALRVGLAGPAK